MSTRRLASLAALVLTYMLGASGTANALPPCDLPVYEPPRAEISLSDASPGYGAAVRFDARQSSPGAVVTEEFDPETEQCLRKQRADPITSYTWDFGDAGSGSGPTADHAYASKGTYTATLTVRTANKTADSTSVRIPVRGVVASFAVASYPEWTKSFDAGASSSPYALDYKWNFGDESTGEGVAPRHVYTVPGEYTVELTVTDAKGTSETASALVRVAPDDTAPSVSIDAPAPDAVYFVGQPVVATYSCSDDQGSGVRECLAPVKSGDLLDTTEPGDKSLTVTSKDVAGHEATARVAYHVVSAVPTVTITAPSDGASYVRGKAVPANFTCAVLFVSATCTALAPDGTRVSNGAPFDTSTLGHHTLTVVGRTPQNSTTSKTVGYDVIDGTAPTATVTLPAQSSVIPRGKVVRAAFSCADEDGGSRLVSCVGDRPVGAAIDTATPGRKTFTVRARDSAGNVGTTVARYVVANYPTLPSSVSLKYEFGGSGTPISITRLLVTRVPKGARVAVRCRGRGCPKHGSRPVVTKQRGRVLLRKWVRTELWPGATLKVLVTKPLATGVETVYRVRRGHRVHKTELCLPPGENRRKW